MISLFTPSIWSPLTWIFLPLSINFTNICTILSCSLCKSYPKRHTRSVSHSKRVCIRNCQSPENHLFHWSWPKYSFVDNLTYIVILGIFFWISRYQFYKTFIFINISRNLLVDSVSFHNQTFSPHSEDHFFHLILLYSDQYITILYTYLLMFWHYFCHDINIRSGRQWN